MKNLLIHADLSNIVSKILSLIAGAISSPSCLRFDFISLIIVSSSCWLVLEGPIVSALQHRLGQATSDGRIAIGSWKTVGLGSLDSLGDGLLVVRDFVDAEFVAFGVGGVEHLVAR